jgi:ribosomal protein S18 acetylase RimI-like enzyme
MSQARLVQPSIRRVRLEDVEAWRDVRLRALEDAPEAFGSTYEETVQRPPKHWDERASAAAAGDDAAMFLADDGTGHLVGLAGGLNAPEMPDARCLIGMWVDPAFRGTRLATRLVDRVLDWSTGAGVRSVYLDVTATNEPAIRFYRRLGFVPTGREQPHPSNAALSEFEMVIDLSRRPAISRIEPEEAADWRATRLAALRDAPDAFGPTYEETLERPFARWTDRITDAAASDHLAVFRAPAPGGGWAALIGAGSTWPSDRDAPDTRHLGSIWVAPRFRGGGLVPRLLDAVLDWAIDTGARRLVLDVTETNDRAIGIYERYGFALTGNRHPLRAGSGLDELEMAMELYRTDEHPTEV